MKGLNPDERHALVNASAYAMTEIQEEKLLRRGLIEFQASVGKDKLFRVTSTGWLALKLDTLARSGVRT